MAASGAARAQVDEQTAVFLFAANVDGGQVDHLANLESATVDGRNQCTASSVLQAVAGGKGGQNGWLPLDAQRSASEFYHCLCRTWSPAEWRAASRVAIDRALAEDGV